MTIVVAVSDDDEGRAALTAAVSEGERRHAEIHAVNLGRGPLVTPPGAKVTVVDRTMGVEDGDMVLGALRREPDLELLVIGVRRRSPVGKALLGDVAQRLLLEAEVPVLAVKPPRRGS
jgi:hypothetical protein